MNTVSEIFAFADSQATTSTLWREIGNAHVSLLNSWQTSFGRIWIAGTLEDRIAFAASKFLELGVTGVKSLQISRAAVAALHTTEDGCCNADLVKMQGVLLTENQDGTVTVSAA